MYTDADAVEDAARGLVERNHQYVLIFAHSYAGAVGSQGIPEELALRARQAAGRPGGVIGVHSKLYCLKRVPSTGPVEGVR